jgi:hypothetical protein
MRYLADWQMRWHVPALLVAASSIAIVALPVDASAGCEGLLPWFCFSSDSSKTISPEDTPSMPIASQPEDAEGRRSANHRFECLSREQIHNGYPRYRVVKGRHCWYASSKPRQTKRPKTDQNPYGDPIWKQPEVARSEPSDCDLQALKLDEAEKELFMKQCKSKRIQ